MNYYAKINDKPDSLTYGEVFSLHRMEDSDELVLERWNGEDWEDDPGLISVTGIGGAHNYVAVSEEEAEVILSSWSPTSEVSDGKEGKKARNYYVDDTFNRDWLKAVPIIREATKFGRFITVDDRVIFTGGPGQGGGSAGGGGSGRLKRATYNAEQQVVGVPKSFTSRGEDINSWDVRSRAKDEVVTALSEEAGVPYGTVNDIVGTWAATSNDSNATSLAVQEEAAKIFGAPLSQWQQERVASLTDVDRGNLRASRQDICKVLHATYDSTQKQLEASGVPEVVTLYRGVKHVDLPGGKAQIYSNTLSSYTSSVTTSKAFATVLGTVMEVQIPRSRIVSTSRTGLGCLSEFEFIVLGNSTGRGDEVMVMK